MTYALKFRGHDVLSQQHGRCVHCAREVTRVLVKTPQGREWLSADQLITGLVLHQCPPPAQRRAA